ncbi:MAG: GWxTD domain-containing protein [Bacteroidia bacterium]|nr:GWxTD domain-containing protein [Bacteroidia bacterium]
MRSAALVEACILQSGAACALCLLLLFLGACNTPSRLSQENLTTQFSYTSDILAPEALIYHDGSDSSVLYFSIPAGSLLYMNAGERYMARMKLHYSVYASYNSKVPLDSGSAAFEIWSPSNDAGFRDHFRIPLPPKGSAVLKLVFSDLNRKTDASRYLVLKAHDVLSPQNFLLRDSLGSYLYESRLSGPSTFSIGSQWPGTEFLWVRCYFRKFPLAVLPFRVVEDEVFEMRSDSVFRLEREQWSAVRLTQPGIYFFQPDTLLNGGLTVTCFEKDFPKVTRAEQLIEATRYLTTRKEYHQLMQADDKKAALDGFWLDIGGSPERARFLIRTYYNRVQEANRLFTSYLEGWKTDRGMIHMILGRPHSIYRDGETEQWTYSNLAGFPDMLFLFRKMNNPFTENDYALIRQAVYENVWYIAVDHWRQGRVVNDFER